MSGTKTIKANNDSSAGVVLATNTVRMHGTKDNYVMADEKGVTINGPVSFVSSTSQMRFAGLWTMSNQMRMSLPSTMATPTPVMMINPPIRQFGGLMKEAVVMIGLLSALG